ncbi:MAG: hypothetical protein EOM20_06815 [Spartobacteria bacterium]|nr:hypothetical protein [Spartobacteria bacterium]
MTKTRIDAWEQQLTDEQKDIVFARMTTPGTSWPDFVAWVSAELDVSAPSRSAAYRFVERWRPEYVARRIQERTLARQVTREQMDTLGDLSDETIWHLRNEADAYIARGDLKGGERLYNLALRIQAEERAKVAQQLQAQASVRAQEQLELDKREFEIKLRTGVEKGLQALFEQVAGNAAAEQLVLDLQSMVGGGA